MAGFGHLLHSAGVPVTPERSTRFGTAVAVARPATIDELYWLGRVTLLTARDQTETYDAVFRQVFEGMIDMADFRGDSNAPAPPSSTPTGDRKPGDPQRSGESSSTSPRGTSATPGCAGRGRPGGRGRECPGRRQPGASGWRARTSPPAARRSSPSSAGWSSSCPLVPPMRTGRRLRRHSGGSRMDIRGTLRRAHRTAGDPVVLVQRKRTERPRRVVLIADVSGSMEPYARIYLHLMRGAVQALHAEAFVFATRLTRLTRALQATHPDLAYRKAAAAAPDWSGGTRIGRALADFLDSYGRRGMARGAVIVIVSDGWEIDDPALVGHVDGAAVAARPPRRSGSTRARRSSRTSPSSAAWPRPCPYVDTFVSGHSLRALEDVMAAIRTATDRTPASTVRHRVPA